MQKSHSFNPNMDQKLKGGTKSGPVNLLDGINLIKL